MELLKLGDLTNSVEIYKWLWWSAILCFSMASTTALRVRNHSQLFMAAMLFAAIWVLVAGAGASRWDAVAEDAKHVAKAARATSELGLSDRVIDAAGFLLVFVGAMLARERSEDHWAHKLHWWLLAGAFVFLIVLVRPTPLKDWLCRSEIAPKCDMALAEVVGGIGFLSLTIGVCAVGAVWHRRAIVVTMLLWEATSLFRTSQLWDAPSHARREPIGWQLGYSFVTLRLIATFIVTSAILKAYKDWQQRAVPSGGSGHT